MIDELILHPRTQQLVERFQTSPVHAVMLVGPAGAGKTQTALAMISGLLQPRQDISQHPYFLHIEPTNNAISIETVRQAQEFIRLKTTGTQPWRRAILIQDAHYLSVEAQNALLKLLEEPPEDTLIVLTALSKTSVLPTISSRAQEIAVKAPTADASLEFFKNQGHPADEVRKVYHMSGGQVGLMSQLLDVEQNKALLNYIAAAKQFLQADSFGKLTFIDQYLKQKESVEQLLWALLAVSMAALYQAGKQDNPKLVKRWQQTIQAILEAQDALPAHPLPKLLLTDLSLRT